MLAPLVSLGGRAVGLLDYAAIGHLERREHADIERMRHMRAVRREAHRDNVLDLAASEEILAQVRLMAVHNEHAMCTFCPPCGVSLEVIEEIQGHVVVD